MSGGMTHEYHEAVRRLKARRVLKTHVWVFTGVMIILLAVNLVFWQGYAWFVWPLLAWGALVAIQAWFVFSVRRPGGDEARIKEILRTLKK